MLHDCRNLSKGDINKIKNLLKIIKNKKISSLFGVSIYSQDEFLKLIDILKYQLYKDQ